MKNISTISYIDTKQITQNMRIYPNKAYLWRKEKYQLLIIGLGERPKCQSYTLS